MKYLRSMLNLKLFNNCKPNDQHESKQMNMKITSYAMNKLYLSFLTKVLYKNISQTKSFLKIHEHADLSST